MDRGVNTNLHCSACLSLRASDGGKTPQSHSVQAARCGGGGAAAERRRGGGGRSASVIRRCGRLTRLSVVSNETFLFSIPLFSNFTSAPCFSE